MPLSILSLERRCIVKVMFGCRQKMVMCALNEKGTTTKAEIDARTKEISLFTKGPDALVPLGKNGRPSKYGCYDPYHWANDNGIILKRLIERGCVVRVGRGLYQRGER